MKRVDMRAARIMRRRAGISELMATLLTVTITIISGSAIFYYINARSTESVNLYGKSVEDVVNFLNEKATILDLNYTINSVTIWLYNSGGVDLEFNQILVYNHSRSLYYLYNASHVVNLNEPTTYVLVDNNPLLEVPRLSSFKLSSGKASTITLLIPQGWQGFVNGRTYYVNLLGKHGNIFIYYQRW
ncbi:MAG: hypothetical protein QXY08_01190 [Nitrososphaerales archaeon]